MTVRKLVFCVALSGVGTALADRWVVQPGQDDRSGLPGSISSEAKEIKPGEAWPTDNKFRWLLGEITIPEAIGGKSTAGQTVALRFCCGDGGEVHVEGQLAARYDNDHPALVLLERRWGDTVHVQVQVFGKVQGGDKFDQAELVIVDAKRARDALELKIDAGRPGEPVPNGLIGLSQGGGLSDYEDKTAEKLKAAGFRWFRMDNVFTNVLKKGPGGELTYDWADFDKRLDFIVKKLRAEPIFAVSYMPQVLDAVENHDRQSAPRDYGIWEELCKRAAARAVERGTRVAYWEVWNEANSGWIKPGPEDSGADDIRELYEKALGKKADKEIIRRFEAYAKLYRASARGVLAGDPTAKVGGPALASGPFEQSEYGFCTNGRGFARGLMAWCDREKLPLDFVSWHEYFHPADIIAKEADAFREYLNDYPRQKATVKSFMITEWNEAWWPNRPQDHEVGSAYCADGVIRAFIPKKIDRPCFFYVKQGDMGFRGDWALIMGPENTPKPTYNMAKVFNGLAGQWLPVAGTDAETTAVACWDPQAKRLAIVAVNFAYRYSMPRTVKISLGKLPDGLGRWREYTIDATHSNVFHNRDRAELERTGEGDVEAGKPFTREFRMGANSVVLMELIEKK